jgi:hypothetical protein
MLGNYPFTTRISNYFAPGSGVLLKVTASRHQCYYDSNIDFKVENNLTVKEFSIEPGMTLAFPMYLGDETLAISIDNEGTYPTVNYYLSAGAKAKSIPNTQLGTPSCYFEQIEKNGEVFYAGATWTIEKGSSSQWQLTIKKYGPDPETDDVTLGPGTPG